MSWFNLNLRFTKYNFWTHEIEKVVHLDEAAIRESERFIEEALTNRGKLVKVIDDYTGREFTEDEIKRLENEAPTILIPFLDQEEVMIVPRRIVARAMKPKPRKYKPRIPISSHLRKAVYQLFDGKCRRCQSEAANQIHHKDGDPSNNDIKNLELLCYPCHLVVDGKKIARYSTK